MATYVASLLWKIVAPLFFTIGTVGNILSILVLTRRNTRKSSTAVYLTALSLSDLIVINTGMVRWWLIHMFNVDVRHFGDVGCRIHWYFIFASTELSSWLLVAVTCERITSTIWPHKVRVICTHRSALSVILCLFIVIYGGSSHLLFGMRLKVVAYEEGGKQNVASIATSPLTPVRQDSQELTSQSEFSGLIKRSAMDQEMSSASIVGDDYFSSATFSDRSHQTTFGDDVPSSTKNNMCKQTSPVQISLVPSSTELSSGPSDNESALSVTTVAFSETSETFTETYETTSFAWNTMITQDTSRTPSISEESTTSSLTSAMTQPVTNVTKRYPTSHITVSTSNFPRLRTEDAESVEDRLLCFALSDVGYSDFFNFVYPWMDLLLYFLVPAVILCIGEIIIVRKLIASNRLRRRMFVTDGAMTTQRIPNRRTSVTIMLMTVNAVFILCTTPISVFLIGMPYWVDPELGLSKTQEILWAVVNLLMYFNHSINFVLYFLSGSRFRSHVYQLFRRNAVRSVHIDRLSFSQKDTASEEASIQRQLTLRSMFAAADKARKISDWSVRGSYTRRHTSEGRDTIPFPGKAAKLMHTDHVPKELTGNDINNKKECLHQVRVSNESVVVGKHTSVTLNDEVLHDTIYTETPFSFIKETNSRVGGHLIEGFGGIGINDIDIFTHI